MKSSDRGKGDTSWVIVPPVDIPSLRLTEEEYQEMVAWVRSEGEEVVRERYKHVRE